MNTGAIVLGVIVLALIACYIVLIVLTVIIDRRTPRPPSVVKWVPVRHADRTDRLELFMLTAIARGDAALAAYVGTRNPQHVIDGVLDMRNRLARGLDMPADELAERLQEEVSP